MTPHPQTANHPLLAPGTAKGALISIEGIDGAGKSSHMAHMAQWLQAQGHAVVSTREPGGTPLAEQLRTLLLHQPMDPVAEVLLAFAARRDHIERVIAPALLAGQVVLSDRFVDATFAYQGAGRGVSWDWLSQLEATVVTHAEWGRVQPELTLWFDVPPEVAAARLAGARAPDKFEQETVAFFERVNQGYARRCAEQPQRCVRINAHQPQEQVGVEVMAALADWAQRRTAATPGGMAP